MTDVKTPPVQHTVPIKDTKAVSPASRRGGVSPKPHGPALRGEQVLAEPRAAAGVSSAFPGFVYNGGPVITCAQVYTSFWGALWETDPGHLTRAGRLSQFHSDLLASKFMNVMSQYGAGFGAGLGGAFVRASFVTGVANNLTDADIQQTIQTCIDAGAIPEPGNPSNIALIIYLDENIGVNDAADGLVLCEPTNDTAFGYHNFFTTTAGHPFYYAVIPGLNDSCLAESCPGNDGGCSLHLAEAQEQRLTQVASHEFAEMITDPQLNAWFDPINGENGDICNGESDTLTVGGNTWTVQSIYSKHDDLATNGATICMSQAPNPEPKLSPGPTAHPAAASRAQHMDSFIRLLPLPPVHVDVKTKRVSTDPKELKAYVKKAFYPLPSEQIVPDLPGFLRNVADILAAKK